MERAGEDSLESFFSESSGIPDLDQMQAKP
jgi:hypothetical protein